MPTGSILAHLKATVASLTNAIALHVAIVDANGSQITSFGGSGGTAAADRSAFTAGTTQGTLVQGVYEATPTTLADGQYGAIGLTNDRKVKVSGTFSSTPITSATTARTNTADSVTSVTVLAANANRLNFTLYNDSTSACYVKCGATASATSFDKKLLPREYFSTKDLGVNYTGVIDAIWETAPGGAMRASEFTT